MHFYKTESHSSQRKGDKRDTNERLISKRLGLIPNFLSLSGQIKEKTCENIQEETRKNKKFPTTAIHQIQNNYNFVML